jgi:acetoacetyl-CoA synthetase
MGIVSDGQPYCEDERCAAAKSDIIMPLSISPAEERICGEIACAASPVNLNNPYIEDLIGIWQRVLDRSPITPHDNFFDLGGDSILAIALFLAIEEATGRTLPVTTIYDAPTVAALAQAIEQGPPAHSLPLVLLKPGDAEPPLFVSGGAGERVMRFSLLAGGLSSAHPVYGVEARGLDGLDPPDRRVEDMAGWCLSAIRARQPHGPYLLAGHSLGGLVMLEVARSLLTLGEPVALLALFDAYPHQDFWRLTPWLTSIRQLVCRHLSAAMQLGMRDRLPYLRRHAVNLIGLIRDRQGRPRQSGYAAPPSRSETAVESHRSAWRQCRPRPYPGKITFFQSKVSGVHLPSDPASVWRGLSEALEIYVVPGDHAGILTADPSGLGERLSAVIEAELNRLIAGAVSRSPCAPGATSKFNAFKREGLA